jgi:hypothetical protein
MRSGSLFPAGWALLGERVAWATGSVAFPARFPVRRDAVFFAAGFEDFVDLAVVFFVPAERRRRAGLSSPDSSAIHAPR